MKKIIFIICLIFTSIFLGCRSSNSLNVALETEKSDTTLTESEFSTDILIVGGGPAGLTLAKTCEINNLNYMLVEKNEGPTYYSKATGVHVSSMKIFNSLKIGQEILDNGAPLDKNIILQDKQPVKTIIFQHGNLNNNEFNLSISQETLEGILKNSLNATDSLFYGCELQSWTQDQDGVYSRVFDHKNKSFKNI